VVRHYYVDAFLVEYPTGSGRRLTLREIAIRLAGRLTRLFLRDEDGRRPGSASAQRAQTDPHRRDYAPCYKYFHAGLVAGLVPAIKGVGRHW